MAKRNSSNKKSGSVVQKKENPKMVDYSNSGKDFEMPVDIMEKWQRMVNIMSKLLHVPTGFIMKVNAPHIQIFTTNVADTNPYHAGQNFELDGLYCEEVMKSDNLLLVPDALKDPEWDNNPEIPAGFVYYLGYPIHWPTGKMFGTICVQDYKNNPHATDNKGILEEFRSVCELDLSMIQMRTNLESIVDERTVDLRMSEERFRMTFEQAAVGVAHVGLDGIFLRINQRFCDIVGYSKEEMLTRTFQDITHPDDLEADLEYVRQVLADEIKTYSIEKRYFKKDGEVVWINLTVSLLREDNGKSQYFIAVVEDISERKEVEEELNKSETNLKLIYNTTGDVLFQLQVEPNDRFRFLSVNLAFLTATGLTEEQIIGKTTKEIIPEPSHTLALEKYKEAIRDKRTVHWEETTEYPTGVKVGAVAVAPAFDEDGNCTHLIGSVHDITERKKTEQTVEEQLAFEQLVSELSGQFVNLLAEEIDSAITQGLGRVAEFIDADRASIVQPEGDDYTFSHYWSRQGIAPAPSQAASMGSYPWLAKQVLEGSTVVFSKLDDLSADAEEDRQMFTKLGIQSLLSLPLTANGVPVGAVSFTTVKHQCHWHEGVIERMKMVALLLSHALERKRSQMALEERLRFQKLVSSISKKFTGLVGDELEQAIQDTLSEISGYFEVDAARIYRLSLKGEVLGVKVKWLSGHVTPPEESPEILKVKHPNMAAHYSQGKSVLFGNIDECPQLPDLRRILNFFGTKAGVGVPLEIDDSGVDIFSMDNVLSEHTWPKDIIEQSRSIGHILLSALRRREAEVKLRDSYDEIKLLKERLEVENIYLRDQISVQSTHKDIIGKSDAMKYVLYKIKQVAPSDATVLILGETGTGKELVAEAIVNESSRRNRPLVKVNCAALPSNLIESELFGREKGAFTGSQARQIGRFELADKGTIFLDEVGELPLELQAKLLRVVQSGEFERLGSPHTVKVDVRIIASTNRDLINEVKKGKFREDLYYRLNVFPVTVPPLRDRSEDIPMIVNFFLKKFGKKIGKQIERVPYDVIKSLQEYHWPGNVRELENIIERSMIISPDSTLHLADKLETSETTDHGKSQSKDLSEVERDHILRILDQTRWKIEGKKGAAEILNLNPSTLRSRIRKLGIKRSV
jgi:PAS domain S-box-containing protein